MARKKKTTGRVSEVLSPQAFADRKGVSRQAVMKAISTGRLKESVTRTDSGRWRIEAKSAEVEWEAMTDPQKQIGAQAVQKGVRKPEVQTTPSLFDGDEVQKNLVRQRTSQAEASAERTLVDAELKRLELEERRGRLVDRQAAQSETFRIARVARDMMLGIPDRLAAELASMTETESVRLRLSEEIEVALRSLKLGEAS